MRIRRPRLILKVFTDWGTSVPWGKGMIMDTTSKLRRTHRGRLTALVTTALVATTVCATPAFADQASTDEVRIAVRIDDNIVTLDQAEIDAMIAGLPDEPTSSPTDTATDDVMTPYLIDWNQWFGCFSLNNEDDVFAEYVHWWNGVGHDVRLKCGTSSWGYKHIRAEHESDWQNQFDAARAAGWDPANDGMESWDDLMAFGAGNAITWPEFKGGNSISQTSCGVTEIIFFRTSDGAPVYSFRTRAGWSDTNDRLITAFPQNSVVC
jgi:hypothetical protein